MNGLNGASFMDAMDQQTVETLKMVNAHLERSNQVMAQLHATNQELTRQVAILATQSGALDNRLDAYDKRLFGNGQPGELQQIRNEVDEQAQSVSEQIGKLAVDITDIQTWRWKLAGVISAAVMILQALGLGGTYMVVQAVMKAAQQQQQQQLQQIQQELHK